MSAGPLALLLQADGPPASEAACALAAAGAHVERARRLTHACLLARALRPDLVVAGAGADADPATASRKLATVVREWDGRVLAIVDTPASGAAALGAGASDFLLLGAARGGSAGSGPELCARAEALLARVRPAPQPVRMRAGPLELDTRARRARLRTTELRLRPLEFALLARLAAEPRRTLSRDQLLREVWGRRCPGSSRTLEAHASRLRAKLRDAGAANWIVNERGVGYRLM